MGSIDSPSFKNSTNVFENYIIYPFNQEYKKAKEAEKIAKESKIIKLPWAKTPFLDKDSASEGFNFDINKYSTKFNKNFTAITTTEPSNIISLTTEKELDNSSNNEYYSFLNTIKITKLNFTNINSEDEMKNEENLINQTEQKIQEVEYPPKNFHYPTTTKNSLIDKEKEKIQQIKIHSTTTSDSYFNSEDIGYNIASQTTISSYDEAKSDFYVKEEETTSKATITTNPILFITTISNFNKSLNLNNSNKNYSNDNYKANKRNSNIVTYKNQVCIGTSMGRSSNESSVDSALKKCDEIRDCQGINLRINKSSKKIVVIYMQNIERRRYAKNYQCMSGNTHHTHYTHKYFQNLTKQYF